jgi:cytidylate kinase
MAVVTISRQYGAGGLRVAPLVAAALDFRLADRELVEEAARRLGVDPEVAQGWDERAPALIEELGLALAAGTPVVAGGISQFDPRSRSDTELAEATRRVIVSLAQSGRYVILGRGGQAALRDRSDAVHLWLVGDLRDRARGIMASQGVDEKEALARCERVDAERTGYVSKYYRTDLRHPDLYHAILNTSRLGVEEAARVAVGICRARFGAGAG